MIIICRGGSSDDATSSFWDIPKFRGIPLGSAKVPCHTPIPGPTRMADPNWVQGARLYTGTLYLLFFFFKAELVPMGIQTISVITKIIYMHKRTTIGLVSNKIYTHILSPIYLYKYLYIPMLSFMFSGNI